MKKCERCNKEHDGSFGSGRFCCRSCANFRSHTIETKQRISKSLGGKGVALEKHTKCLNCDSVLGKSQYKYCSNKCQYDFQYKKYIVNWKAGKENGLKPSGMAVSRHIHRYLREKYNNRCSRCGWDTPNPYIDRVILEIEHIDGKFTNNKEDNLDLICPNCHSLTPTYKSLNSGNADKARLRYHKLI